MATSVLHVSLLLAVLCVTDGQSTTSEDSQCSYTFKVPATECGFNTVDDQFMKSSMIALQTQMKLLAAKQAENIRKLTDENEKLRQEIEAGRNRSASNSCDFIKKSDDTVLRVVWNGGLRLIHEGPKRHTNRRWFFTINGRECSDPKTIDTEIYVRDADSDNVHRPAYVEGYCRGIPAGDVYVAWNVGDVLQPEDDQSSYNVGDSWTGWMSTVRIIVEEVDVDNADAVIV